MKIISNIQVLRGLAALGVMLSHAAATVQFGDVPSPKVPDFEWGAFGVDVFFVISGFIMSCISVEDFGSARSVLPFVSRRIIRIVPLYWLTTLAFVAIVLPFVDGPTEVRQLWQNAVRSMFFVPARDGNLAFLPPGWTLSFEMLFYGLFAAVLPLRRTLALAVFAVIVAALMTAGVLDLLPARFARFGTAQLLEFVAGLCLAEAWLRGWRVPRRVGYALATLTTVAVATALPPGSWTASWRGLVWGVPATAVVACLALAAEPLCLRPGVARRILEHLGSASYSLYLTHFPLIWICGVWLFWIAASGDHGAQVYVSLLVVLSLSTAFAVHLFIERPLLLALRSLAGSWARHRRARMGGQGPLLRGSSIPCLDGHQLGPGVLRLGREPRCRHES